MSQQSKKSGFTLIELLVVISIIALLLGILVPVLGVAKKNANILKESVNLRNIHAALATYGTSNKDWFPGYTASGKIAGVAGTVVTDFSGKYYASLSNAASATAATTATANTTSYAQAVLLDEGGSTPAQWVSPGETNVTGGNTAVTHESGTVFEAVATKTTQAITAAATSSSTEGNVSVFNSSFAVLAYGGTLKAEWKSNQNQQAVVLGSRMLGGGAAAFDTSATNTFNSVWTDNNSGSYKGSLVRGDTSTVTETFKRTDIELPFGTLKYGSVAGTPSTATTAVVGPFGQVTVITGAATYGTTAGDIGASVVTGAFTTGQIVSGLN